MNQMRMDLSLYVLTLGLKLIQEAQTMNKPVKADAVEVLEFLNLKTGRNYRPVDANIKIISARLREGATVQECRCVIAKKCRDWLNDEMMNQYLRPATLFNATKFAQYVGELSQ